MTLNYTNWLKLDAGQRREALAEDLAAWRCDGFWGRETIRLFDAKVRMAARSLRMIRAAYMADLHNDAELIYAK